MHVSWKTTVAQRNLVFTYPFNCLLKKGSSNKIWNILKNLFLMISLITRKSSSLFFKSLWYEYDLTMCKMVCKLQNTCSCPILRQFENTHFLCILIAYWTSQVCKSYQIIQKYTGFIWVCIFSPETNNVLKAFFLEGGHSKVLIVSVKAFMPWNDVISNVLLIAIQNNLVLSDIVESRQNPLRKSYFLIAIRTLLISVDDISV